MKKPTNPGGRKGKKAFYSREIVKVQPLGRPKKRAKLPKKSPPPVGTNNG